MTSSSLSCWPRTPAAAPALRPIRLGENRLDVPGGCDRHDELFIVDEVFEREVTLVRNDPAATLVAELVPDLRELLSHHFPAAVF